VGSINILDKEKTKTMGIGDGIFPDHIAEASFDEKQADDALMFHLPGSYKIVIHERVRRFIEAYKIPHITYLEDSELMG
jgi:hypothetical protein